MRVTFSLSSRRTSVLTVNASSDIEAKPGEKCDSPEDRRPDSDCGAEEPSYKDSEDEAGVGGEEKGSSASESEHGGEISPPALLQVRPALRSSRLHGTSRVRRRAIRGGSSSPWWCRRSPRSRARSGSRGRPRRPRSR